MKCRRHPMTQSLFFLLIICNLFQRETQSIFTLPMLSSTAKGKSLSPVGRASLNAQLALAPPITDHSKSLVLLFTCLRSNSSLCRLSSSSLLLSSSLLSASSCCCLSSSSRCRLSAISCSLCLLRASS